MESFLLLGNAECVRRVGDKCQNSWSSCVCFKNSRPSEHEKHMRQQSTVNPKREGDNGADNHGFSPRGSPCCVALYARTTVHKEKKKQPQQPRAADDRIIFGSALTVISSVLQAACSCGVSEMHSFRDFLLELWSGHVHSPPAATATTTTTGCYSAVGASYFQIYSMSYDNA